MKDFIVLFLSKIFQKFLGLIREPIIAYFFGSSLLYSNYLLLRSGADFFSQFTVGNALKTNLLPKFSKLYNKYSKVSLKGVFLFSKKVMIWIFVISQLIQSAIILVVDPDEKLLFSNINRIEPEYLFEFFEYRVPNNYAGYGKICEVF